MQNQNFLIWQVWTTTSFPSTHIFACLIIFIIAFTFHFNSLGSWDQWHIASMYGLCMSMLVPQKGFLCPTVSTIASGKPSQMLMGNTQAMKRKRVRTNFSKQNSPLCCQLHCRKHFQKHTSAVPVWNKSF